MNDKANLVSKHLEIKRQLLNLMASGHELMAIGVITDNYSEYSDVEALLDELISEGSTTEDTVLEMRKTLRLIMR